MDATPRAVQGRKRGEIMIMVYINKKHFRTFLHDKGNYGLGILFQKYNCEKYLEIHLFKLRVYIGNFF